MKKTKTLLFGLLCALGLSSLQASALEYKQVGTPNLTASYGNTTSYFPTATVSKYSQGITIYKKEAIGLDAGYTIKELSFLGYQGDKNYTDATISVYVANTTSTSYTDFIIDGENEGSVATTKFDTSKATLFYEGAFEQAAVGAKGSPEELFKVTSSTGIEYTGDNLVVYIYLSTPKQASSATFYTATQQQMTFKNIGAYRESSYSQAGHSVDTKKWSTPGSTEQVPVMTIGYEAGMTEKQIGTPVIPVTYANKTSNYPVYTMSKFGQGLNIYKKEALGLDAGTAISEIGFIGYQESVKDFTDATAKVYLANGTSTTYTDYIVAGEAEGGNATTVLDPAKFTLFYEGPLDIPQRGSSAEPVEILTFKGNSAFDYSGDNLVVVVEFSVPKAPPYTTFATAKQTGTVYKNLGAYRESGYSSVGYGINTKKWNTPNTSDQVPVMVVRYGGAAQAISATVTGRIYSSLKNSPLGGATVTLMEDGTAVASTTSAASSGMYEFNVEAVNTKAVYTVSASCEGYEPATVTPDLKAGGNINDVNLTLTKLPVPATLSGFVVNKDTKQPVADVAVAFNGATTTSAADGAYSFAVENIDLLPADGVQLTAACNGYNDYSTSLRLTADMEFNIELQPLPALEGEGTQVGQYNVNDYDYQAPFNSLWKTSITQVIYPKELLGDLTEGEKFSSISFYGYLSPKSTPVDPDDGGDDNGDDYGYGDYMSAPAAPAPYYADVTIYMRGTESTGFTSASEGSDFSALPVLYSGTVEITEGGAKNAPKLLFTADFDTPFEYDGQNIELIVEAVAKESRLVYFAMDPAANSNVITKFADKDISTEPWRLIKAGVPVMKLGAFVPSAEIYGRVTDARTDGYVEGAVVTLSYENETYTYTTGVGGDYIINVRDVKCGVEYVLNVACEGYIEQTEEVVFTADDLIQNFDFALEKDVQTGTITGTVVAGEGFDVENEMILLLGAEGNVYDLAWPEADGSFKFEDVEFGEYTVFVDGYEEQGQTVEVTESNPDVTVTLEIVTASYGTISGTVTDKDGEAFEYIDVYLYDADGECVDDTYTDTEGHFEFYNVEYGSYSILVDPSDEEYQIANESVDVDSELVELTIVLEGTNTGLDAIFVDGHSADVYTVSGILLKKDATADDLKALPAGIYVIGGKKVNLKH